MTVPWGAVRGSRLRHALLVAVLVFAWCALWGEFSVPNLLSGLAIAVGLVWALLRRGPTGAYPAGVRLGALARLGALVAADLAISTVNVAREVLTPTDHTDEAIVAVQVPPMARHHLLLLVVGVTVTPGTAVVDTDPETPTLYLHLLHRNRRDEVVARVHQLATLACAAFPMEERATTTEGDGR